MENNLNLVKQVKMKIVEYFRFYNYKIKLILMMLIDFHGKY